MTLELDCTHWSAASLFLVLLWVALAFAFVAAAAAVVVINCQASLLWTPSAKAQGLYRGKSLDFCCGYLCVSSYSNTSAV